MGAFLDFNDLLLQKRLADMARAHYNAELEIYNTKTV
jgi:hypothetical protein